MRYKYRLSKAKKNINNNIVRDSNIIELENVKIKNEIQKYMGFDDIYNMCQKYNAVLAGGAIVSLFNNTEINDFDLYFKSKEDLFSFLVSNTRVYTSISYISDKSVSLYFSKIKVQLIYMDFYESIQDLFEHFDFECCMGAYDFVTEKFYFSENFFIDNMSKTIHFNPKAVHPISSLVRVNKYINKGYSIGTRELFKIALSINKICIDSPESLKIELSGIYGENFNKVIEKIGDAPFSLDNVLEILSKIDSEYFENHNESLSVPDVRDYGVVKIAKLLNIKFKYFSLLDKHGAKKYYLCYGDYVGILPFNEDLSKYEEINPNKYFKFPLYRYKYVCANLNNDDYSSFYNPAFKYKVNDFVRADKLFCGMLEGIGSFTYANRPDRALLKLRIDSMDDFVEPEYYNNLSSCIIKKAFVEKIYNKEEMEEIERKYCKNNLIF
ncbi:MAG: hypothetical protein ACI4SM_03425 [Candidatus Gastranaerophilaceae bacterium]